MSWVTSKLAKLAGWGRKGWAILAALVVGLLALFRFGSGIRMLRWGRKDKRTDKKLDGLDAKRAKLLTEATKHEQDSIRLGRELEENQASIERQEFRIRNMSAEEVAEELNSILRKEE